MSDQTPPELKLSLSERALLLILMAENTELSNPEIRKSYAPGLELTGEDRKKLVEAKLVECRRGARGAYFFTLADDGWAWCRAELAAATPKSPGSGGIALYSVLGGVDRHLRRTGLSLAQIFGDSAPPAGDLVSATVAADDIEVMIRRAYRELADPAESWVGFADIRAALPDVPRRDFDGVLRLMVRMPGVWIEEETNQKTLKERDRAASVRIGGRDQHVLRIAA
jgi:hypothetical protein